MLDKNTYTFLIDFKGKENMSKILTFSDLFPDNLASYAAAPSTIAIYINL